MEISYYLCGVNIIIKVMKKLLILLIALFPLAETMHLSVQAKTTYIPTYRSFIQIMQNRSDSIMAQSNLEKLELTAQDGSFSITLVHEDVDKQKVKAIKRAKAAAGWMTFAAVMSGVFAGFDAAYYNNALNTYINMRRTENLAFLSDIMHDEATVEQRLTIDFFIDNLGEEELMVADLVRGLTWYIRPHTSLQFSLANPGIERLRISDLNHLSVKYADIIGGNSVRKEDVEWEDDNCWIVRRIDGDSDPYADNNDATIPDYSYHYIDKATFESREITVVELKEFKKKQKIKNKENAE